MRITSCASAPSASQRSAISLVKQTFSAWKALQTYLTISAVRDGVCDRTAPRRRHRATASRRRCSGSSLPTSDERRMIEVLERRAFAHEFGIDGDPDHRVAAARRRAAAASRARARSCPGSTVLRSTTVSGRVRARRTPAPIAVGHARQRVEVGLAVPDVGRADADQRQIGRLHGLVGRRRSPTAARRGPPLDQFREARLDDRRRGRR